MSTEMTNFYEKINNFEINQKDGVHRLPITVHCLLSGVLFRIQTLPLHSQESNARVAFAKFSVNLTQAQCASTEI